MAHKTVSVGNYLLYRLKEVGVETLFGVPGDYNMPFLDLIEDYEGMDWGNNCNELNAACAADGYARMRGVGAVVTTFGVGELNAVNGIAGSYSEMVPVVHIAGSPNTASQARGALLHHTLGNGDFRVFRRMFSEITIANTSLTKSNAVEEVDRILRSCVLGVRPVYIDLPIDVVNEELNLPEWPPKPLDLTPPPNPPRTQQACLKAILSEIRQAKRPILLVDACAVRHNLEKQVQQLMDVSGFPTYVAPMGKGAVSEDHPQFRGCYAGNVSHPQVQEEVHNSDLVLSIGSLNSDFNTGGFTYHIDQEKVIDLHSFATIIYHANYEKGAGPLTLSSTGMRELLPLLIENWPKDIAKPQIPPRILPESADTKTDAITQSYFWPTMTRYMDRNAVIVAETGTAEFGIINMKAPEDATFVTQVLWGSIGYSVGAAMGAQQAARLEDRRVFLFVGDGSFQVSAQEVSTMLRKGQTPVIILINNDGYTIEKLIHGAKRKYNNVQMWEYSKTLEYFGAYREENKRNKTGEKQSQVGIQGTFRTRAELEKAMEQVKREKDKIHFLEVMMDEFDAPQELKKTVEQSENR
ncbi:hypothetical protein BZG36_01357 [Bifiguratus adelaidae]|uniref:Pyruvate decarboxylase n=1 Tax=Bifiguratus adelaidae TaxID=1938954 RepID=A0A261Y397_9FUNG|nr:hypothetical protein BZG36_01357 [Bifiguratus adelaidae]